jgi:uncharacterized protein YukE
MEVGQLFFSLGFKSSGTAAAEKFESVTSTLAETSTELLGIFERINYTLERVALKMQAVTQEELDLFKQNQKTSASVVQLGEDFKDFAQEQSKQAEQSKKGRSLYSMFVDKLDGSIGKMNRVKVQIAGIATAMTMLTKKSSDYAASLVRFNQLTGLSTQQLQMLQNQAAGAGLDADEVAGALKELQEASVNVALGRGGNDAWQLLGLRPGLDPFAQIEQLKKAMNNMSAPFFTKLAKEAGLSESFIGFMRDMKNLPPADKNMILSEDEIGELKAFNIQFNKAINSFQVGLKRVGAMILPITKQLVYLVDRWGWGLRAISDQFNHLSDGVKSFLGIVTYVAAAFALSFSPITLTLTAIILLIDDFLTYMQGGDSVIGRFLKYFEVGFQAIKKIVSDVLEYIDEKVKSYKWIGNIAAFINKLNPNAAIFNGAGAQGQEASKKEAVMPFMEKYQNMQQNVTNNIEITIDGANTPEETAQAIKKMLDSQNSNGYFQNGNTGR